MKNFMDEKFLLSNKTAEILYENYASKMPIIDYHCHLPVKEIAEDVSYSNITELWLAADHYKWRAMRSAGVSEKYITGDASDYEKFREYCKIMPSLIGNPVYHWSHLELRRYFDCNLTICEKNCDEIWQLTAEKLKSPDMTARRLIERSNCVLLCTTDDPADLLEYHKQIAEDKSFGTQVLPAFRPDTGLNIERSGITAYVERLGKANGVEIKDLAGLMSAYEASLDRFEALGCRTADHGMDDYISFAKPDEYHADLIFKKALASDGKDITEDELTLFKSEMLYFFGKQYKKRGWVMQLHFGVARNPNTKMFKALGRDSGYDNIHGKNCIRDLGYLLDYLTEKEAMPRTILYSVNPADNEAIGALIGSFQGSDGYIPTVMQGSAWWFNDNIDGMRNQMRSLANLSAFGRFLGMLTDSRSFTSYPRHEYFRRILCDTVGSWVEEGLYPADYDELAQLICDICYNNAKNFFGFKLN